MVLSDSGSYVSTPAEVGHLLQSSVSEFPLEQLMELSRQEVTDLHTNKQQSEAAGRDVPPTAGELT